MISVEELREFLVVSIALSTITCSFVQKTKALFRSNKYLLWYSFIVNIAFSIIFCSSFTNINFPMSLWTGLFSFIGADTIYKTLEGKISTHEELRNNKSIYIKKENILNEKESSDGETNISK